MTVAALHKKLSQLMADGHGRKSICIHKRTFTHPLESDGAVILDVSSVELLTHEMLDENGSSKELANGCIAERTSFVLYGNDIPIKACQRELERE